MAIKGSIKESGLADVCQLLSMGQKTGCLSVTDQSRFGQLFFDRGRITFATIVNRRDRIGDLLVREGAITEAQLREVVDEQGRRADRRLGELLLEHGYLDADTLAAVIRRQIEEAVFYLFTWRRGSFHFEADRVPDGREILISVNPEMLLLEGARRIDEWAVIETKIPSLDMVFAVDGVRLEAADVSLTSEQELVLPLMDGRHSVQELAEAVGIGEFAAAKAIYGLVQAGFAHPISRRADETDDGEPEEVQNARNLGIAFYRTAMLEDAEREFRRVLQHHPDDATARQYLALVALRQGDAPRATRLFTALLESTGPRIGTYLNLACSLRIQHRYEEARQALEEARTLAPEDMRIRLAEGATALFAGDPVTARGLLREYRREVGQEVVPPPTYYYCAGLAEALSGQPGGAEALVAEGLEAYPASAPLLLLLGNVAERKADMPTAERAYQKAAEEDPSLAQCHRNLGDMAHRRGALHEAIDHYRRATEVDPDLGDEVYTRLAELHYHRNEREQAIRCWRRAVEINPRNEVARTHLDVVGRVSS
jgi:tetratricopeptide (TPR) repeat protein